MVMQAPSWPRLSDAKTLLPLLRACLAGAAPRYSLPVNISIDLLPICEDGLFGYELVPDRNAHTYLTIGLCESGEAILRRTMGADAPSALRLAAVDGKSVSRRNPGPRHSTRQRDFRFAEIADAVEAGLSQLVAQFPEKPRQPVELQADVHRYLDQALAIAHAHLSRWDPFIRFVGLPNEAQYGFALTGDHGECGELLSRRADMWVLRWKSPEAAIYEEWALLLPDQDAASEFARA
jgi:hypothetical protein